MVFLALKTVVMMAAVMVLRIKTMMGGSWIAHSGSMH